MLGHEPGEHESTGVVIAIDEPQIDREGPRNCSSTCRAGGDGGIGSRLWEGRPEQVGHAPSGSGRKPRPRTSRKVRGDVARVCLRV
jgi:hypothetical protein